MITTTQQGRTAHSLQGTKPSAGTSSLGSDWTTSNTASQSSMSTDSSSMVMWQTSNHNLQSFAQ